MTPPPCIGPCNGPWRKAEADYAHAVRRYITAHATWTKTNPNPDDRGPEPQPPDSHTVTPYLGAPVWCARCPSSILSALIELDDLAAVVAADAAGHRSPDNDKVTGTSDHASPSPGADIVDEVVTWLERAEDLWRDHCGHPDKPERTGPDARLRCIAWLAGHARYMLACPSFGPGGWGAADFGQGVLRWRTTLQAVAGLTPERRKKAARCSHCKERNLWEEKDSTRGTYIKCHTCGRLLNPKEYDDAAEQEAAEVPVP